MKIIACSSGTQQLNVDVEEVEELLIGLILEGKVDGRIDQVGMRLELDKKYVHPTIDELLTHPCVFRQSLEKKRYAALQKWTETLESVHGAVVGKTAARQNEGAQMMMSGDPFSMREERQWM